MKLIFLFTSLFFITSCKAQPASDQSTENKIDTIFQHVDENSPGYMIGVMKDGKYIFKKGYGLANLEYQIPISSKSVFNIASLSKQFTAACVALLMLEEKISMDDPVLKFLPDFPKYKNEIQVKHLIYMTSGINDYYYNPRKNKTDWSSLNFFNIDTAIQASLANEELMYEPGTQWSYSNINYMLLTKIVEKISGKKFSEFAKERIFEPLKMSSTVVNDDIFQVIPNRVDGYNYRDKENTEWLIESGYLNIDSEGFLQINRNSPHYGGSGVFTSLDDMKKWMDNFQTKTFGGDPFYQLMHKTMKFQHDKSNDAFGLIHGDFDGHKVIWYDGGDWGVSSYMVRFPKSNINVLCFSNLGTGNAKKRAVAVLDILVAEGLIKLE